MLRFFVFEIILKCLICIEVIKTFETVIPLNWEYQLILYLMKITQHKSIFFPAFQK